jgi:capsular exopolysaccharide synthesis family protein
MGRIDEALRRSRASNGGGPVAAAEPGDMFRTAWTLPEETLSEVALPEEVTHVREAADRAPKAAAEPVAPVTATPLRPQPVIDPNVAELRTLLAEEPSPALQALSAEWADRLAVAPTVNPVLVEQFRRLAATLYHAQTNNNLKVVMVTSATAGDGKTMTAVNLALTLSESYKRKVLLVDTDLRRPSISNISNIAPKVGLSDGLKSETEQKLSVFQLTDTLTLLPAGRPDPDPMSGLTSPRMRRIVDEAASRFDWVILDAPPVGPVADANLLAAIADAVLLVVRAGVTRFEDVQKATEALGRERIFGVVLNGVEEITDAEYNRHYATYHVKETVS